MSDSLEEFQRKIRNRKFSIENSWKADTMYGNEERRNQRDERDALTEEYDWEERFALLNDNIQAADSSKFTDGYFPIHSQRKYLGKAIIFFKRAVRKILKILMGWYIFPILAQASYFRGKMVNAISLERELLIQLQQQLVNENEKIIQELHLIQKNIDELSMKTERAANIQNALQQEMESLRSVMKEMKCRTETSKEEMRYLQVKQDKLKKKIDDVDAACHRNDLVMSDEFYHGFEEAFRGSQEDIKDRLQVYVPILKEHLPDWKSATFIDVGSGRGEWLDVLKANGAVDYVGVDLNQVQNKICEERGHRTVCMDCVQYLKERPDESVNLVTGFQIIEHLPLPVFVQMLEECKRVLKPGGMILFETQNPQNLIVGADTFYIDPSHIRPLEPKLIEFLTKWSGFENVEIIGSNTTPVCANFKEDTLGEKNKELVQHLNDISWKLFGPQDYAVFAVKG